MKKPMLVISIIALALSATHAATWQMKQHDMEHTGRADFNVPPERLNHTFFDVVKWQKPSPGAFTSTSMTFYDAAGPGGNDIVVGGYHLPKGVQGMNRHTGEMYWTGNPSGGETIGCTSAGFSNDGTVVYVNNDSTASPAFPNGHPLMAFSTDAGPATFRHNGADVNPSHLYLYVPTIAPDGRIFLHPWGGRPYAGADDGSAITQTWAASTHIEACYSDPALYQDVTGLKVIANGRRGYVKAYDGTTGVELWSVSTDEGTDAGVTIDPDNGNIYLNTGPNGDIYVVALDKTGQNLWASLKLLIYDHVEGVSNPQRAQAIGCLSHDGSTYYFQTNSRQGDGRLYAIKTSDGSLKWSFDTNSTGWEFMPSSPIVTQNGIIIIGNNDGGTYYSILDGPTGPVLLDSFTVDGDGYARASATLSRDGLLYLPLRTVWVAGNGDSEVPDYRVENLFTAFDLNADAVALLYPPSFQSAVALNNAVFVRWKPIPNPGAQFDHYAIYRDVSSFSSVSGMTPIGTVHDVSTNAYLDSTAVNGTRYYYAVTTVSNTGGEIKTIESIGPRNPYDETDLQIVSISRTPRYPRYCADYTYYQITEPSGFGPYIFSAATSLCGGQDPNTPHWPEMGEPVTYTATVRNRGTNLYSDYLSGDWRLDGVIVSQPSKTVSLPPGSTTTFTYVMNWDNEPNDVSFTLNVSDARASNNQLTSNTLSAGFLTYVDVSFIENFREIYSPQHADVFTDDMIDWLNYHMARFNQMFADANCLKRVHYEVLEVLDDEEPDPSVDRQLFGIFPFRYHASDGDPRRGGYYRADEDIDYGLLHEMGHQLGLIDIYQLDIIPERNLVSGLGFYGPDCLMRACSVFLSEHSALAMNHWLNVAHGYYGQYLYCLPSCLELRILGFDGQPLDGATIKMYQYCERPGQGKIITDQIKAQGTTDANGIFTLPNVPIDSNMVPITGAGDELHDNPFGYVAVVGTNGLLHFRIEYNGGIDYTWLDITQANVAYWKGHTDTAIFDRQVALGGPLIRCPPREVTELNAFDWSAWAQGSTPENSYVQDDTARKLIGASSIEFVTDGGFDAYVRYPCTFTAQWDLTAANFLNISLYAENPNIGFQSGSPWIHLRDSEGDYFEYQYYRDGHPYDLLNEARGMWRSCQIPLDASPSTQNGWRRTPNGSPDVSSMQSIEIHADTWGFGFTLWLDGVGFDLPDYRYCDFNFDDGVNLKDLCIFGWHWLGEGCTLVSCQGTDLDQNRQVDFADFAFFASNWLQP